jgi:hypothetical protein
MRGGVHESLRRWVVGARANPPFAVHGAGRCRELFALTRCSLVPRPVTTATTTLDAFQVFSSFETGGGV